MSVSLGIYSITLLFIYIIIPGFIARRFYYHGEFSKQIKISTSPIVHIVYSSFTGIFITFLFVSLLNCSDAISINFEHLINTFKNNFSESSVINISLINTEKTAITDGSKIIGDNSKVYTTYLPFIISLYVVSAVVGYYLSKIVIFYKLDTKFKFLRFNNDWHYVFNGKIFQFKKHSLPEINSTVELKYTYINVLTKNVVEENTLYSGFLADYELCSNNTNKIERIHLLRATKNINDGKGSFTQKNIPGNLFTIQGENILNINCVYICYDAKELEDLKTKYKSKVFKYKSNILFIYQIIILLTYITISISLLFKYNFFNIDYLNIVFNKSILYRSIVLFMINVFVGILNPFKIDFKTKKINFLGRDKIFLKIVLIVFLLSLLVFGIK